MALHLDVSDGVAVITMDGNENRFRSDSLAEWDQAMGRVEALDGPLALVVTGVGKFFCNGIDVDHIVDPDELAEVVADVRQLLARLLVLPAYSVCAINGHAFGAGAVLTCSFDHRIMRSDRGFWCLNEAELGIELDDGFLSLLLHRLERRTALDAIARSTRFGGRDALNARIVDEVATIEELRELAVGRARHHASVDRSALGRRKRLANADIADTLAPSRRLDMDPDRATKKVLRRKVGDHRSDAL